MNKDLQKFRSPTSIYIILNQKVKAHFLNRLIKVSFIFSLLFTIQFSFAQGQFGGKIAVMDGLSATTWYNTSSQSCDGAGTGNLSASNPTAISAYLGDKFYLGGNVLTFGFGSTGDIGQMRYAYYAVGGSGTYSSYVTLPYANNTVCGGGSNKKYELIPATAVNTIQATASGNFRLDVDLRANNNGTIYSVFTSGNYIPFTVSALSNPTAVSAACGTSTSQIDLSWSKWNSRDVIVLRNTTGTFTDPTQGTTYNTNDVIGTGLNASTVVYRGGATSFSSTGLTVGTQYYYKVYSENYSYYSSGTIVNATTRLNQPSVISGGLNCAGTSGSFSVTNDPLATSYSWTLPSGWNITSGLGTNSISVSSTSTSGTISVTANNSCGASASQSLVYAQTISFANTQFPASGVVCPSGIFTAYGQIYGTNITETAGAASGIVAQLGYGAVGTNPNTWVNWNTASYNVQVGNNDEYVGTISPSVSGAYAYAFRYSLNGCSYIYGGYSGGFWNGTTNVSGSLTVSPNASSGTISGSSILCNGSSLTYTSSGDIGGTWSSTNTSVATVNATSGLVSTVGLGTTTIKYTVSTGCNSPVFSSLGVTVNANVTYYADVDGDTYGNATNTQLSCAGVPSGYVTNNTDCNDANVLIYRSALLYTDADADGYDAGSAVTCYGATLPVGTSLTTLGSDCNDANASMHTTFSFYTDADHDTYGTGSSVNVCAANASTPPTNYSVNNTDCNDANVLIYRSALLYTDADADGYDAGSAVTCYGATLPVGTSLTTLGSDCNDTNASMHTTFSFYTDADHDTYGAGSSVNVCAANASTPPTNYSINSTDCDDTKLTTHPGAVDVCYDGIDNDCNGNIDNVGLPGGCTPIVSFVVPSQCGSTLNLLDDQVISVLVANAQGYRWRITKMIAGSPSTNPADIQLLDTGLRAFKFVQLPSYAFDTTYQVEVSVRLGGVWQPYYGSACTVKTPATTTKVLDTQCGTRLTSFTDIVYAGIVPYATGYRFRVTNLLTSTVSPTVDRSLREFRFSLLSGITYNTPYKIEVAIRNTDGTYLPYGPSCNINTPSFPTTQLQTSQCDYTATSTSEVLYADLVSGATAYKFSFENGSSTIVSSPTIIRSLGLSTVVGLMPGVYSVKVAVQIGGIWGPYGKTCTLTLPGTAKATDVSSTTTEQSIGFEAIAYPNPFAANFKLEVTTNSQDNLEVRVYDMIGKQIEDKLVKASDLESFEVGADFPSGVYNVVVIQGEQTKTLRVIKR